MTGNMPAIIFGSCYYEREKCKIQGMHLSRGYKQNFEIMTYLPYVVIWENMFAFLHLGLFYQVLLKLES